MSDSNDNRSTGHLPPDDAQQTWGTSDAGIEARSWAAGPAPVAPVAALAEEDERRLQAARARRAQEAASGEPDVLLDVPQLAVDEIELEVQNLHVNVALDARLGNLLLITAGAEAHVDSVKLTIKGVRAEALLKVKLDNLAAILDRTLTTIDRNPQILMGLLRSVDHAVDTVGGVAQTALLPNGVVAQTVGSLDQTLTGLIQPGGVLSQTLNALGQTVQRTVDLAGNIGVRTLDGAGAVIRQAHVGTLGDLEVVDEITSAAGEQVRRLRDVSGALIEATLTPDGDLKQIHILDRGGETPAA